MKIFRWFLPLFLFTPVKGGDTPASAPAEGPAAVVAAGNKWAQQWLLAQAGESPGANVCLSSLPLMFLCAETAAGAGGETRAQLLDFLNGEKGGTDSVFSSLASLNGKLAKSGGKLFLQRRRVYGNTLIEWNAPWLERVKKDFGARFIPLDFSQGAEKCRQQINADIQKSTRGLIKNFVSPDMLTETTGIFLVDVTGYAGTWKVQFDPRESTKGAFVREDGKSVSCRYMKENFFGDFGEGGDYTVIWREYRSSGFCFFALLPARGADVNSLLKKGAERDFVSECLSLRKNREATKGEPAVLKLPAFTVSSPLVSVKDFLKDRGVTEMFLPGKADLSGMTASKVPLYVQDGWQKVYFKVDETGTQAYAASALSDPFGTPPAVLSFDRPFLYILADTVTGAALFMGVVADPSR